MSFTLEYSSRLKTKALKRVSDYDGCKLSCGRQWFPKWESSKDFWCHILTRQLRSTRCGLWHLLAMNLMSSLEPPNPTSGGFKREQHKQTGSSLMEGSHIQNCGHHVRSSRNCCMVGVSTDALKLGSETSSVTFDALGHKENFERTEYV